MSSCPTPSTGDGPTRREHLLAVLERVPDPRDRRGIRYPLAGMLALAVTATLAGATSFAAIGEWAADATDERLAALGITRSAPDESTLRKLFARVDANALDEAIGVWMWTRSYVAGERRVIALDGKTVRGARRRPDGVAPHLVAAFDHDAGVVLGQVGVDVKSNEIPAVRTLLGYFDLNGVVATLDAMHTQTDTAQLIIDAGGQYVLTVKNNTPTLRAKLKKLPWKHIPATSRTTRGHGQKVTRTIKVTEVPDWVEFPGAAQVAQLRRTVTRKGKKTTEIVYLVTSAGHREAPPDVLASWVRGHWGIENRLHWVRDSTLREDLSQVRTGHLPRIMATIRSTVISLLHIDEWSNIAAALRHHARHPDQAINLLLTW